MLSLRLKYPSQEEQVRTRVASRQVSWSISKILERIIASTTHSYMWVHVRFLGYLPALVQAVTVPASTYYTPEECMLILLHADGVHAWTTIGWWCSCLHHCRLVVCMLALLQAVMCTCLQHYRLVVWCLNFYRLVVCMLALMQACGVFACTKARWWCACLHYSRLVFCMLILLQAGVVQAWIIAGWWCTCLWYCRMVMCMFSLLQAGVLHPCPIAGWCFACLNYCRMVEYKPMILHDGGVYACPTAGWWLNTSARYVLFLFWLWRLNHPNFIGIINLGWVRSSTSD